MKKAGGRKVRRIKKSLKSTPSSQGAAFETLEQSPGMGDCTKLSTLKSRKEKEEWEDFMNFIEELELESKTDSEGDFEGIFTRDPHSNFRKIINERENNGKNKWKKDKVLCRYRMFSEHHAG